MREKKISTVAIKSLGSVPRLLIDLNHLIPWASYTHSHFFNVTNLETLITGAKTSGREPLMVYLGHLEEPQQNGLLGLNSTWSLRVLNQPLRRTHYVSSKYQ